MKKIVYILFAILFGIEASAQNGTLDPSFGNGGVVLSAPQLPFLQKGSSSAKQCFVREDGKLDIVILGNKTQITRRLSNGQLDETYANKGYSQAVTMIPICAVLQQDGKIVVGGSTNGFSNFMIVRYQINGNLDSSFGNLGVVIVNPGASPIFLSAIVISPEGKIIVAGNDIVAQFTMNGVLDASFGVGGIASTGFNGNPTSIASLAIQSDGKILAGGTMFNFSRDFALARYNADGSPDLTLNGTGYLSTDFGLDETGESVVMDADKIYMGGFSADGSGNQHFRIARYNSDGSSDATFNGGSILAAFGSHDVLISMKLQADGKLLATGRTDLFSIDADVALVRINPDGSLDNGFGNLGNGLVVADLNGSEESTYLTIQPDGKILAGGSTFNFTSSFINLFTCFRFDENGIPDAGFGNNGAVADAIVVGYNSYTSLFAQSDGKITGICNVSNGSTTTNFGNRLKSNGTPDSSFGQNGVKEIAIPTASNFFQPDGKILSFDYNTFSNVLMTRYNSDGSPDLNFGTGGVVQVGYGGIPGFQPDGKIVIGGYTFTPDGGTHMLIGRYNADGSIDQAFGTNGFTQFNADTLDNLNSISIAPDGKIIVGASGFIFTQEPESLQTDVLVLRLNPDGTPDPGFGDGGLVRVFRSFTTSISSALATSDNKIVLTYFVDDNAAGIETVFLERLNSDGKIDNTFADNGKTPCDGPNLLIQPDQKIITSGYRVNAQNNQDFTLSRFNSDGSPDASFGTNGKIITSFTGIDNFIVTQSLSGNSLFVAGGGVDRTGINVSILAKFLLGPGTPITCPENKIVNTDKNKCSAKVFGIGPTLAQAGQSVKYKLTGATTGSGNGSASGKTFNKGITTVTYIVNNDKTKTCSFTVTVEDKQAPAIYGLSVSPANLSSPDHKMGDIIINYSLDDNCGIGRVQLSVSSNEPVQSNENGDQSPDWQILDNHHIKLRAESLASGSGRVYTLTLTVTDVSGNQTSNTATVRVPKSNGNPYCRLQVSASPNPSHDCFLVRINSNCSDRVTVRLFNNCGNILTTINNLTPPETIRIGERLHSGIYFLEVTQAGNTQSVQLIKL